MIIIELALPQRGSYDVLFEMPGPAILLALFLTDDLGSNIEKYIREFEDDEDYAGAMNATQYTKEEGVVTLTYEFEDEQESIAKGHFFAIKSKLLAELLRQWKVVFAQRPSYITITIINDHVKVIGSDTLTEERVGRRLNLLDKD
jgi:hypothetical protein